MKIDPLDTLFSRYMKLKAEGKCEFLYNYGLCGIMWVGSPDGPEVRQVTVQVEEVYSHEGSEVHPIAGLSGVSP